MEFHLPTAGITAGIMIVLFAILYYIVRYLTGGQHWFSWLSSDEDEKQMKIDNMNNHKSHHIALGVFNSVYNKMTTDYYNTYGIPPDEYEKQKIWEKAMKARRETLIDELKRRNLEPDDDDDL